MINEYSLSLLTFINLKLFEGSMVAYYHCSSAGFISIPSLLMIEVDGARRTIINMSMEDPGLTWVWIHSRKCISVYVPCGVRQSNHVVMRALVIPRLADSSMGTGCFRMWRPSYQKNDGGEELDIAAQHNRDEGWDLGPQEEVVIRGGTCNSQKEGAMRRGNLRLTRRSSHESWRGLCLSGLDVHIVCRCQIFNIYSSFGHLGQFLFLF